MTDPAALFGESVGNGKNVEAQVSELQSELASAKVELERLRFHVSHDLRAPLRHIRAFVQVIQEDHAPTLEEPVQAHLKTILQSADQAMKLLDGFLATPEAQVNLKQ